MRSQIPKVLHEAAGRPLIYYPVKAALDLGADAVVVVVGPVTEAPIARSLEAHFPSSPISTVIQEVPLGTGDAAKALLRSGDFANDDEILLLSGDVPLLTREDLLPLLSALRAGHSLSFLSFFPEDPHGYGRVLRDADGRPQEIREQRDLRLPEEHALREVNSGIYAVKFAALRDALVRVTNDNAQGEYYLTDIVKIIAAESSVDTATARESSLRGVNDRAQLAAVESILFVRRRQTLGEAGVTLVGSPLIDDTVLVEPEVIIEDGVRLRGETVVRSGALIDVGCVVTDSEIGPAAHLKPYSVVTESLVGERAQVGPFAHLRPESVLEADVHVGNFVETKKALLKKGAKANHLTYLGDAEVGERTNIGAGTIVCNYNGYQKQRTVVEQDVFIGSASQLVAPVTVKRGAYVATGTTVTENVPEDALAIGRTRQQNKDGYGKSLRERFRAAKAAESGTAAGAGTAAQAGTAAETAKDPGQKK